MLTSVWTDELIEKLKRFHKANLSSSEIAALLGHGLTRNAIIGKIARLRKAGEALPPNKLPPPPKRKRGKDLKPRKNAKVNEPDVRFPPTPRLAKAVAKVISGLKEEVNVDKPNGNVDSVRPPEGLPERSHSAKVGKRRGRPPSKPRNHYGNAEPDPITNGSNGLDTLHEKSGGRSGNFGDLDIDLPPWPKSEPTVYPQNTLLGIRPRQCHYPLDNGPPFTFCTGTRLEWSPYCEDHHKLCYVGRKG